MKAVFTPICIAWLNPVLHFGNTSKIVSDSNDYPYSLFLNKFYTIYWNGELKINTALLKYRPYFGGDTSQLKL